MQVSIKDLAVDMPLGNKGIELDVYDGDEHLGDLVIGKAKVVWCKGKTRVENGITVRWHELIAWFEGQSQ